MAIRTETLEKSSAFDELEERLIRAKRCEPGFRYGLYIRHAAAIAVLFAISVGLVLIGDLFLVHMASAVVLAIAFAQGGFLMHSIAHLGIPRHWRNVAYAGIDFAFFWSTDAWKEKHDAHHARPNSSEDPDFTDIRFISLTPEQARKKKGLYRLMTQYQHWLVLCLLFFQAGQLRCTNISYLLRQRTARAGCTLLLMGLHVALYFYALFSFLPLWHAMAFILVHNGLLGFYLGVAFAPNHIGMPPANEGNDYVFVQASTAGNISGEWWVTMLLGGLNFQIEHHLFPCLPDLYEISLIVRPFCKERGIPYRSESFWQAWQRVILHLREMAMHAA